MTESRARDGSGIRSSCETFTTYARATALGSRFALTPVISMNKARVNVASSGGYAGKQNFNLTRPPRLPHVIGHCHNATSPSRGGSRDRTKSSEVIRTTFNVLATPLHITQLPVGD